MRKTDLLALPIAVSAMAVIALYELLTSPETTSNKIIVLGTLLSVGSATFAWVRVWARSIERRFEEIENSTNEELDELRNSIVLNRAIPYMQEARHLHSMPPAN